MNSTSIEVREVVGLDILSGEGAQSSCRDREYRVSTLQPNYTKTWDLHGRGNRCGLSYSHVGFEKYYG